MKLFNRLQEKLLQKDLKKDIAVEKMVKKYPISLLIEKGVLTRYKDTAFYCADMDSGVLKLAQYYDRDAIYTINGEMIGFEVCKNNSYLNKKQYSSSKFILVAADAKFGNTNNTRSIAIYEKSGKCVVPHGCYKEVYMTDAYTILSMPETQGNVSVYRVSKDIDENGKKIIGSLTYPQALIVGDNKIITTKYSAIFPLRVDQYQTNTIWIAQNRILNTCSIKIDKKFSIRETYKFPTYNIDRKNFIHDDNLNTVYYLNKNNGLTRVNLRNGEEIDLLSLKKIEKTKETMSMKTSSSQMTESVIYSDDHIVL